MNLEHATPEMFDALSQAQAEIENASKNAKNPHFNSKYADLAEVLTTIRETFPKHGLSLLQAPSFDGSMAHVTTLVTHKLGGYITSVASCVPAKSDAQGIGAATTYLRRYGSSAMAGIAQEDDDGQAAKHDRKPVAVVTLPAGRPMDGVWESLDEDEQQFLLGEAEAITASFNAGDVKAAHARYTKLLTQERLGLWSQLGSKVRTALKKADAEAKQLQQEQAA